MIKTLQFKVSRECTAVVNLVGEVTQEAIQKLIQILELCKDTYPTTEELRDGASDDGARTT